ncbi:triose-phosphate isomerase [Raineyella fluvialis]|uniref:Triosephosphate isomerase n=1 Tax=Raineyella fluvialis TaxID=2662261 RepID=A0A5Q2F8P3_9ACTN|nr:triose-phosphate isomerase [Raineyella fluvialis]QGF23262.1 triose-phosphate isomerase [Raineyella fluvialis]
MLWVGTSWKMNGTLGFARDYATRLAKALADGAPSGVQPFIIPPATALTVVRDCLGPDSPVLLGVQNAHWEDAGAWTGEISVPQAAEAGAALVEIGHSERREFFGETDATVNLKVRSTLRHGLRPILCVGESAAVFEAGDSVEHVLGQVAAALADVADPSRVVIAYEPIWAIGEHGREARPADIAPVFAALADEWGDRVTAILYGGSVNPGNAVDTLRVPGVDGLFVGRAAWTIDGYLGLLDIAAGAVAQVA